jgi:Tol biopolymer transport system component
MIVPFDAPTPLLGINTAGNEEDDPSLTGDMLEIFFLRSSKLWTSLRPTTTAVWPAPTIITELDGPDTELRPSVSADGKTLYFTRRPAGQMGDIYVSIRAARGQPWSIPSRVELDVARTETEELCGWSSPDGTSLLVTTTTSLGDRDLYLAVRSGNMFTTTPVNGVNSTDNDGAAWATADGNQIVFESDRYGTTDIWEAIKRGDTWDVGHHPELSTGRTDGTPWLSADGAVIVYSQTSSTDDLFMATRAPQR